MGQSQATEGLAFLVTGDLAFFYDMNSLRIRHVGPNVRILLCNNHGGEEFYYNGIWQKRVERPAHRCQAQRRRRPLGRVVRVQIPQSGRQGIVRGCPSGVHGGRV